MLKKNPNIVQLHQYQLFHPHNTKEITKDVILFTESHWHKMTCQGHM